MAEPIRKKELPLDLKTELDSNDSYEIRVELLLVAMLRTLNNMLIELKRIR